MNGQNFLRITNETFSPFLKELGFVTKESSISGRLYNAQYTSQTHAVWVSYEPGDEVLSVLVFSRSNGELSDIDDRAKTPRLTDLNSRYMAHVTKNERHDNEVFFKAVAVHDKEERLLLKAAKELRLVLPKYVLETTKIKGSN